MQNYTQEILCRQKMPGHLDRCVKPELYTRNLNIGSEAKNISPKQDTLLQCHQTINAEQRLCGLRLRVRHPQAVRRASFKTKTTLPNAEYQCFDAEQIANLCEQNRQEQEIL